MGLATGVSHDPHAAANELLEKLLTRSPDAVAAAKRLYGSTWARGARITFAKERVEQLVLLALHNTRAARQAAFSRVTPIFEPRTLL